MSIRLRGFSAGSYTAAVIALLLRAQELNWQPPTLSIGGFAGPVAVLTALFAQAAPHSLGINILHVKEDALGLGAADGIPHLQSPPYFRLCYFTGYPRWMRAPYHDYAYLLDVELPHGLIEYTTKSNCC